MQKLKYKAVFFDLDGTITNPKFGITKAVRHALNHFGKEVNSLDDLECYIGPPLRTSFAEYGGLTPEQIEEALPIYREHYKNYGLFDATVFDGVKELLHSLHERGVVVVMASSKLQEYVVMILEHFGLADDFDLIAGSDMACTRSEKWEVLAYALQKLGIQASDSLMIGDRKYDVYGAHKNNMACVAVEYGFGNRQEFLDCGADYIVGSVKELATLLEGLIFVD